jgi:hypothetical protein
MTLHFPPLESVSAGESTQVNQAKFFYTFSYRVHEKVHEKVHDGVSITLDGTAAADYNGIRRREGGVLERGAGR